MAQIEIPSYKRMDSAPIGVHKKSGEAHMRLKKFDYIAGVASFLLARASMLGQMSPFAVAFFASSYTKARMPLTILCTLIGCLSTGMGLRAFKYLIAMAIFAAYKMVFDKKNTNTPIIDGVVSGIGLIAGGMAVMSFGMVLAYNVALLVIEGVICGFLTIVFREVNEFSDKRKNIKSYVTNEQLLSVLIIFGLSVAGMNDLTRMGPLSLSEIVCVISVVLLAYCRGMAVGACAGACAGVVCAMNTPDMLPVIGIYTLCGFLAGCAKPLGKYGVALTFAAAAASLGFMTTAYVYGNVGILNFIIGAAIFALCPQRKLERFAAFADGCYTSQSERPYMQRMQELIQVRMGDLSTTFDTLAASFDELSQRRAEQGSGLAQVFDDTAQKICAHCGLRGHCWDKEAALTHKAIGVIGKKLGEKGYADVLDLPQEFREKCVHANEFVSATNHFFEIDRINALWEGQLDESRHVLSQQYRGFAKVMNALSAEMSNDIVCESKYEKKIVSELIKNKISLRSICVFERPDESFEVEVEFYDKEDMEEMESVQNVISQVLKQPMHMTHTLAEDLRVIFEPLLNYKIISGVATLKKDGQECNGDSYCAVNLCDNRYAIAISDGMGSGESAACESSVTINLLKKLLLAGFDKTAAIQLINSALVLKSGTEAFATIDLSIIDLVNARAEFMKIGAATGYIRRADSIESIFCSTLPVGILTDADIQLSRKRLHGGDCIVMVSDGVANAKKNVNWICETLMGIGEDEQPETIAEIILKEAVIHKRGTVDDDMTVIAAKILEK